MRLTAAQALIRFLAQQYVERDGVEHRFFAGCFGIFGHGNVAGIGEALYESPELLTYYQARNEQSMVHTAAGYARMRNRLATLACTTSIGPGATLRLMKCASSAKSEREAVVKSLQRVPTPRTTSASRAIALAAVVPVAPIAPSDCGWS